MMEYKVGKMEYGKEVLGLWRYICVDWYIQLSLVIWIVLVI